MPNYEFTLRRNTITYAKADRRNMFKAGVISEGTSVQVGGPEQVEELGWDHRKELFTPLVDNQPGSTGHFLKVADLPPIQRTMLLPERP